ncbi:MAG: UDP-N-acetylmuramate:L-alanyl-gamma-D-glutamyl-meso-diaminopimelate ligase [Xanthomonadaceae bacterium]|nr:UDP-N-acetylmuramate:L-alanyl-gamma-D-glutamyl-meso-diaminopimelate ligase [Xanthomonadaceae bacterium]MDP2186803.1 UDP-N-acetylmuramate:L-alanyl-gamma-D-glutamyl-meso-diaminopimelate ligase [Xanthomonadales bacterium]MDZ4117520.1 UDP-N-acetylmuramate:L-alanyl-gamma-D-glutamyl-meso-diaminopimelate ligase [Xanthomonadaceae bacterium]
MKLHILGICGTFMGGVAALARELGHDVSGSDANVYPPMSSQLEALGIALTQGYAPEDIPADADVIVVGNALSRGNPSVEAVLNAGRAYTSGAQWLAENVLPGRRTLAVAGTHGKTTTSSLLAYILERAGRDPGFLIGGVPENFGVSARIGGAGAPPSSGAAGHLPPEGEGIKLRPLAATHCVGREFVVEADEYDTAFFDKRSKFVHYRPWLAILSNLEYDHADIFPDVAAIQRQFHHLLRIVPGNGRLIVNADDDNLAQVLAMGCWSPVETFGERADADWRAQLNAPDGSVFTVLHRGEAVATARWSLLGRHNVMNALAAIAAAHAVGVPVADAVEALAGFRSVKRRLQVIGCTRDITVYDDFAHHPTAIATTLAGLRANVGSARIVVAMEPRSNSMRLGVHAAQLAPSLADADAVVFLHRPGLPWDAHAVIDALHGRARSAPDSDALLAELHTLAQPGDHVVFMSNGGFDGAPQRFFDSL